ncbi:MAG TPA: hypothetical protein VEA99_07570, partial [Gemmatimonadaceae bacterium]|nr:hypothetical protein [Gemmatimonadaceae bacterium]
QDIEINGEQLISINVGKKAKDTLSVEVVLDSIAMNNSMMGAMDVGKAKGVKVSSLIAPSGRVYSTAVPDTGVAADVGDELARILPRVAGSLKVGTAWTDTLTGKRKAQGMDVERTVISSSKVVGDTTIAGEKVWKIERTSEAKMSGSGATQGQPISMEGTSTGTGFLYVSPKGTFVAADSKDDVKLKVTVIANGMEIGMSMVNTSKVEKIQ